MSVVFRATLLWNEVVTDFESNMRLKRHRFLMKSYPNSFTGREAVKFLLKRLLQNELFGPNINSMKVKLLLDKMFWAGVFEHCVRPMPQFRSKGIYRFCRKLPVLSYTQSSEDEKLEKRKPIKGIRQFQKQSIEGELILEEMSSIYSSNVHVDENLHIVSTSTSGPCSLKEGDNCVAIEYSEYCEQLMISFQFNRDVWRNKIINRMRDVLGPSSERLLKTLCMRNSIWVSLNASLIMRTFDRRNNFPLVDECLLALGFYGFESENDAALYANYPLDITQFLCNILLQRYQEASILSELGVIMVYIYCFLSEFDGERKVEDERLPLEIAAYNEELEKQASEMSENKSEEDWDPEVEQDEAIQDAKQYLWHLTTPTRVVRGDRQRVRGAGVPSCGANVVLETAFFCQSPVTRVVDDKHARCSHSRCVYDDDDEQLIKIQKLLETIMVMAKDFRPEDFLHSYKLKALFANMCNRRSAKKWLNEVKTFAIHLYRLAFLFLEPEDYYLLEATLYVLEKMNPRKQFSVVVNKLYESTWTLVFGDKNDGFVYKEMMTLFIKNREELFKPFDLDQILGPESVSFFKDMRSMLASDFTSRSSFPDVAKNFPHRSWTEPSIERAFHQMRIESRDLDVEVKPRKIVKCKDKETQTARK
ncbi:uncharacterized protein LOC111054883 isoform X2 [Nilaparvata lugens]|uniref:uncharacterized protein LOC111054883 isoform X2 n=1 Tax=Nilaparvata lugens TaxID=108931 RepID=UPI00193E1D28|nr:uncharacterized protein LOC111054883 isoform X2 [Nilaparvata lugens]